MIVGNVSPRFTLAPGGAAICTGQACRRIGPDEARALLRSGEVLLAHAPFLSGRLRAPLGKPVYDALELFAFVRPGPPLVPSALGLLVLMPATTVDETASHVNFRGKPTVV